MFLDRRHPVSDVELIKPAASANKVVSTTRISIVLQKIENIVTYAC
jgi:hypothetical protein